MFPCRIESDPQGVDACPIQGLHFQERGIAVGTKVAVGADRESSIIVDSAVRLPCF